MLVYLALMLLAYASYRLGIALWMRSVGAMWWLVPALAAFAFAFWLVLASAVVTRGLALLLAGAVWGGMAVGSRLAGRSRRAGKRPVRDRPEPEAPWRLK